MPTRNIKITVTTLENKLEDLKLKYRWLQDMYDNSESACRYFALNINKYNHLVPVDSSIQYLKLSLNYFKLKYVSFKDKSLRRSLSCPNVNNPFITKNDLAENQFRKLLNKYLDKETKPIESDYFKKLSFIYNCFKVIIKSICFS